MLGSTVIELARLDGKYRDEAAADILWGGYNFEEDDGSQIWARFFASKYPKDSEARLFLLLDGLDEAEADGRAKLIEILRQIRRDDLNIQVVLSSRPDIESTIQVLQPATVERGRKLVRNPAIYGRSSWLDAGASLNSNDLNRLHGRKLRLD